MVAIVVVYYREGNLIREKIVEVAWIEDKEGARLVAMQSIQGSSIAAFVLGWKDVKRDKP